MSIREACEHGRILLGLEASHKLSQSLSDVLRARLIAFHQTRHESANDVESAEHEAELQWLTAQAGVCLLEELSHAVSHTLAEPVPSTSTSAGVAPLFGAKDLQVLRQLGAVVARWGLAANCKTNVLPTALKDPRNKQSSALYDKATEERLQSAASRLARLFADSPSTEFTNALLPQLQLAFNAALFQLGESPFIGPVRPWATDALLRLLDSLPVSTCLQVLLAFSTPASAVRAKASGLLSKQLGRSGAVRALLVSSAQASNGSLEQRQLDSIARLLEATRDILPGSPPSASILEQVLDIVIAASPLPREDLGKQVVREAPPIEVTRAATYILSRFGLFRADDLQAALSDRVYDALMPLNREALFAKEEEDDDFDPQVSTAPAVLQSLAIVSTLLLYGPPSSEARRSFVAPLIPSLLSLYAYVSSTQLDTAPRDMSESIFITWIKGEEGSTAVKMIRTAIEVIESDASFGTRADGHCYWARSDDGRVCIRAGLGDSDDDNFLTIDASVLVGLLKKADRKDVTGNLFLRWLDEVQQLRDANDVESAKRTVLRLQLVMKIVEEIGSQVIQDPVEVLQFVLHSLQQGPEPEEQSDEPDVSNLRIVPESSEERDEDEEGDQAGLGKDEMALTALTLLLSTLEGNATINRKNTPVLALIASKLDSLASSGSALVAPLAREARLTLSARDALSTSEQADDSANGRSATFKQSKQTYQEALKLLQDPILPVRAQGLAMIRGLVASKDAFLNTDPALLPAVLDIFVQALEDDDSFLYLSAIQGLSSMADGYGRRVVKKLVAIYTGSDRKVVDLEKGDRGRMELDKRLRMGEALVQCLQRAGEALAVFVHDLVPAMLGVMRQSTLPTALRSSALTILTTAVENGPTAILPYASDLLDACLTLLSVETRPMTRAKRNASEEDQDDMSFGRDGKPRRPEELPDPLTADTKHPIFRRAAVLLIGILLQAAAAAAEESSSGSKPRAMVVPSVTTPRTSSPATLLDAQSLQRIRNVLGYVRDLDSDGLVRHQADVVLSEL